MRSYFPCLSPQPRLGRVAILWWGDEAARRSATPENSRFKSVFAGEINVSSVFPIPDGASAEIARRVADQLRMDSRQSRPVNRE
jgi:hypothetical protein